MWNPAPSDDCHCALYNAIHTPDGLMQVAETRMDDSLLNYYKKEWDRITTSMSYISKIFRYLVRKEQSPRAMEDSASVTWPLATLGR